MNEADRLISRVERIGYGRTSVCYIKGSWRVTEYIIGAICLSEKDRLWQIYL